MPLKITNKSGCQSCPNRLATYSLISNLRYFNITKSNITKSLKNHKKLLQRKYPKKMRFTINKT